MFRFSVRSNLKFEKLSAKTAIVTRQRLKIAGQIVTDEAKRLTNIGGGAAKVPSIPGEPPHKQSASLQSSISWRFIDTLTVGIGPSVMYGLYLEFGTRKIAARPFMRPALDKTRKNILMLFKGIV